MSSNASADRRVSREEFVPVRLRVGATSERVIGTVAITLTTDADGVEHASVDGASLAALLHAAADEFQALEKGTDS